MLRLLCCLVYTKSRDASLCAYLENTIFTCLHVHITYECKEGHKATEAIYSGDIENHYFSSQIIMR